ncbi:MAG: metal ABC transporter ATP-binding protein [Roseateles sp.]|uniref:metal ABC transporter ATP-binding protein n=1 Tax=Roseateles sp. TaxID=1971397 RepID=UPI00403666A4
MNAVILRDLIVAHRGQLAVGPLSGAFEAGTATAIVGPNGAGKSSLLAAIAGRLLPVQGSVSIRPGLHHAWLEQHAAIDRSLPLAVADLVALGAWQSMGLWRGLGRDMRRRVEGALEAVGLASHLKRMIGELSGGQLQRALFARVLMQDVPLILLDEPFNAIDPRTTADLLALISRLRGEGRTVIAVLHDLGQVHAHFDRTLLLAREPIAWGPTSEVLTPTQLRRAQLGMSGWHVGEDMAA